MALSAEELKELIEAIYTYVCEQKDGVLQSVLWKEFKIDSKTCSNIVKKLEEDGRIVRIQEKKTYLIVGKKEQKNFNPELLMAGETIVPCVACTEECDVSNCKLLEDWIYELVFSESQ